MAALDWHVRRTAGVTLVELLVTSDTAERVRIETELAPVWPPRRQGRPVEGWDDTAYEGIVGERERLALGFASPAPPAEPPAVITESEPVDGTERDGPVTADDIVRTLGEGAPPRDVVPTPKEPTARHDDSGSNSGGVHTAPEPQPRDNGTETLTVVRTERRADDGSRQSPPPGGDGGNTTGDGVGTTSDGVDTASDRDDTAAGSLEGEAVEAWLDAVESRAGTAERLASVTAAGEARTAVADAGGIEGVRELAAQLEVDRQQLDALRARQRSVADRLESVELPLATLERLA